MVHENAMTDLFSHHVAATQLIAPGDQKRDFTLQTTAAMSRKFFAMMSMSVRTHGHTIITVFHPGGTDTPPLGDAWMMMPTTDPAARASGDDLDLLIDCKLWAPAGDGPIVIVAPKTRGGHYAVSTDRRRLEHRRDLPATDLTAGLRRAKQRIACLAVSKDLRARPDTILIAA